MDNKIEKVNNNYFSAAVQYLLVNQPFYGYLFIRMNKIMSKTLPALAGVSVKDNKINLYLHSELFETLGVLDQVKILQHELLHVVHNHMSRGKQYDQKMFNKAADLAINQLIPGFPDKLNVNGKDMEFFTLNNMRKWMPGVEIKELETAEYYYDIFEKNGGAEKWGNQAGKGKCSGKHADPGDPNAEPCDGSCGPGDLADDHEGWGDNGQDPTVAKEIVREAVNAAKQYHDKRAEGSGIGNLPAEVLRMIQKLNQSQVDWKRQLRSIVANSEEVFLIQTRQRRNRRFGFKTPGEKKECKLKIGVIMDVSGSTHCGQIHNIFVNELHGMQKQGAVIDVIQTDTEVHAVERFNPKKQFELKGGGGTDMNPGILRAKKEQPDIMICLTDGYIPEVNVNPGCMFVWCVIDNKEWVKPFGKKIDIESVAA